MNASAYIYASGKIRALEPMILDDTDIERMVDAPDLATAFKVLNDTDYADNLLEVEPVEYRQALSDDYRQLYDLLMNIAPDKNLLKLIFADRDLVNIKLLLKAKYFEVDVEDILKDNCVEDVEKLKTFIREGRDLGIDTDFKTMIENTVKQLGEEPTPNQIDTVASKEYFALLLTLAKRIKSPVVTNYVNTLINNANVKVVLRSKRLDLERHIVEEQLISGGSLSTTDLAAKYTEDVKELQSVLSPHYDTETVDVFSSFAENGIQNGMLYLFEKALEDYKTRIVEKAKFITYGPEVVLAYHAAKQNAVANIRIIMTGKMNNMDPEEIKKTLRIVR